MTLADRLCRPTGRREGVILLSPAGGSAGARIHFMTLGRTSGTAMVEAREAVDAISALLTDGPANQQKGP